MRYDFHGRQIVGSGLRYRSRGGEMSMEAVDAPALESVLQQPPTEVVALVRDAILLVRSHGLLDASPDTMARSRGFVARQQGDLYAGSVVRSPMAIFPDQELIVQPDETTALLERYPTMPTHEARLAPDGSWEWRSDGPILRCQIGRFVQLESTAARDIYYDVTTLLTYAQTL